MSLVTTYFAREISDCPIVLRKQPQTITKKEVKFKLNDIPFQMVLNASTQIFRSSLVDENVQKTMKLFKEFKKQHIEIFTDSCTTHLVISTVMLDNFCGKSATVYYNKGVTKVVGANGAGKTVQYASALLLSWHLGFLDSVKKECWRLIGWSRSGKLTEH